MPRPALSRSARPARHLLPTLLSLCGAALAAPEVFIAYPVPDYRVKYDHVILEGSVTPGATLTINGQGVNVGPDGLFMEWWPLKVGQNTLKLVALQGGQSGSQTLRVTRLADTVLPATPSAIVRTSVTPRENLEFWDAARDTPAERTVAVSFQGSPGGRATFHIAGGPLQAMREGPAGTYSGAYVLPENASALNAAITVHLTGRDGRTVTAAAPGRLTSIQGALKTGTQKPGTIKGQGLNDALNNATTLDGQPLLYPRDGMTFTLVGRQGRDMRARLAPGVSILISTDQLSLTPGAPPLGQGGLLSLDQKGTPAPVLTPTPPSAGSTTAAATVPAAVVPAAAPSPVTGPPAAPLTIPAAPPASDPAATAPPEQPAVQPPAPAELPPAAPALAPALGGSAFQPLTAGNDLRLRVGLGGLKVPFLLTQAAPGQLQLTLFGLLTPPTVGPISDPLVRNIAVQTAPGQSRVILDLNTAQTWGFTANYEGVDLVLRVRRPPTLNASRPLQGRTITLDPGHGGTQKGGAGSLRVPEKDIVLPIALRVAELLRAQGATVNLTRTGDVTLGLYERDLSAEQTGSDLLVSIHANALPDGRDPRGIRGPEVHYTHPQAQNVAQSILNGLRARLPELGPGKGLMPDANLALTRPTTQISLLVETAYLTDAGNLRVLMTEGGRERFAQAIAGGIVDFYLAQAK